MLTGGTGPSRVSARHVGWVRRTAHAFLYCGNKAIAPPVEGLNAALRASTIADSLARLHEAMI
jgi:hypothetical protein